VTGKSAGRVHRGRGQQVKRGDYKVGNGRLNCLYSEEMASATGGDQIVGGVGTPPSRRANDMW
jgi:hypothetical protein